MMTGAGLIKIMMLLVFKDIAVKRHEEVQTGRTRTFLKNRDSEPFLRGLLAGAGLARGLATADWTVRVPVRVWAESGCSVAPPCPVMLTCIGMKVMPPLSLAMPAEVKGHKTKSLM